MRSRYEEQLKELIANKGGHYSTDNVARRTAIYDDVLKNTEAPENIKIARVYARFLREKDIVVREYDLLAGHGQYYRFESSIPISTAGDFDLRHYPDNVFDVKREADACIADNGDSMDWAERDILEQFLDGIDCKLYKRWGSGHVIPGYNRMLSTGLAGNTARIYEKLNAEEDAAKRDFYTGLLIVNEASRDYIRRYSAEAHAAAAKTANGNYRSHLLKIAESCEWISSHAPRGFFDAVQMLWLLHELMTIENHSGSISLGRLDQYLYPFYKKDIDENGMSYEDAGALIKALWVKFAEIKQGYQNVTLGGYGPNGGYAANDVSRMCMDASRELMFDQPLVSVRWNADMPEGFWGEIQALKPETRTMRFL